MSNKLEPEKLKSLLPYFLLALAVIVTYKVVSQISFFANIIGGLWKIVTPFLYGFILAYIVNIPYGGIKKILGKSRNKFIGKLKKPLSIIITLIFFALIILSVLYLIIPYIYKSISFFISALPVYYERIQYTIEYINNMEIFGIHISAEGILHTLQEMFQDISVENFSSTVTAIFGVGSAIFTGILALISSIYILAEKQKFKKFLGRMLAAFTPDNIHRSILDYAGKLNKNFKRYIHIQTIDGLILGTIVTIELLILRSPYALFLGIMLGIVNYIPYFGSIFGSIIVVIIVAFTQGIMIAAIAAVVLLITQQIDGNIIQPRLMGGSFSLSPLLIIISITVGGAAAGIFGMIAAIPIVAVLKDILENIIKHYERKKPVIKPPDTEEKKL